MQEDRLTLHFRNFVFVLNQDFSKGNSVNAENFEITAQFAEDSSLRSE